MLTSAWSGWSQGTWRRNRRFEAEYRKKIVRARFCLRSGPTDKADRDRDLINFCNVFHNLTVPRILTYDVSAVRKRDQRIRQFHVLSSVITAEFPGDHELLVDAYFSDIMAGFGNEMTIQ